MNRNDLDIGKAGEHLVIADLLLKGHKAFLTDQNLPYDVVVEVGNRLVKLQVKTTRIMRRMSKRANPIYFFHIKRSGKNGLKVYTRESIDGWALVCVENKSIAYLSFDKERTASICIRDDHFNYLGHQGGGKPSGLIWQKLSWENFISSDKECIYADPEAVRT